MRRRPSAPALLAASLLFALPACAPEIGDACETSSDCSVNGDRFCDVAQPGGYCTVIGCDADTCPDDALCVEWRFDPTRSAETWCMRSCGGDRGDCSSGVRDRDEIDSYRCVREGDPDLNANGPDATVYDPIARVIDLEIPRDENGLASSGFCAAANAD